MDDAARSELQAISDEVDHLIDEVDAALDEHASHAQRLQTRARVEEVAVRFRKLIPGFDDRDRLEADRKVGRKLLDMQKVAMALPAPPQGAKAQPRASNDFFETREGKSSNQPRAMGAVPGESPRAPRPKYKVTGDVDAWCGPCGEVRVHTIVAMVGDDPAQVVCQTCNSRHKYRTEPARGQKGATASGGAAKAGGSGLSPQAAAANAKMDAKNAFVNELRTAATVRAFSPRDRYKAGEIIDHPEHGRGRIENALPNSLLVRFASGLKPVKLA
jgi:hypothetical protein